MSYILEINELTKNFRSNWTFSKKNGIQDVTLKIKEGDIFGFLGHNGAGKTTTMKCVLGLLEKYSGSILLHGQPLGKNILRKNIGYLPELPYFYDHLSVEETLSFFAQLYGLRGKELKTRVDDTLLLLSLHERRYDKVKTLSKGLQQRLAFAQAIVNRPSLLLLDEPFSGLDPTARVEFRKIILDLHKDGTSILLSSHILSDVQDICNRVAIMAYGKMRCEFDLEELTNPKGKTFILSMRSQTRLDEIINTLESRSLSKNIINLTYGELLEFEFENYSVASEMLNLAIIKDIVIEKFSPREKRLEEVFIEITKQHKSLDKHNENHSDRNKYI